MAIGKHVALATELEKDILSGAYGREGGLPSVGELAQTHNMSINTVKSALALLEGKDLIEKRGIGYYVNRITTTMTSYVPPAHVRAARGGYCENIGPVKRVNIPTHLTEKLHLPASAQAVYRMQLSGEIAEGNERPLQLLTRYYLLPLSDEQIARMGSDPTYDPMWNDASLSTELMTHDEVSPRLATEGERDLLNLPENTPVTSVFETIADRSGATLFTVQEIVLSPRTTLIFDFPFVNKA